MYAIATDVTAYGAITQSGRDIANKISSSLGLRDAPATRHMPTNAIHEYSHFFQSSMWGRLSVTRKLISLWWHIWTRRIDLNFVKLMRVNHAKEAGSKNFAEEYLGDGVVNLKTGNLANDRTYLFCLPYVVSLQLQ